MESAFSGRGARVGALACTDIQHLKIRLLCNIEYSKLPQKIHRGEVESLPTIAFAVPPNASQILASTYSYRLMRNFGSSRDYREDPAAAGKPVALFAGAADELMFPDRYRDAVGQRAPVRLIDGVNHMGIVSDPAAVSVIADEVVKAVSGS
jgi:pimeloyl-ACP methyl ester carboxylesterase